MAGIIIGLMYGAYFAVLSAFDAVEVGDTSLVTIGRLVGGLVFGWALVFIYYSKSELLTSNMMIVCIGGYYNRITWGRGFYLLGLCLQVFVLGSGSGLLACGFLQRGHGVPSVVSVGIARQNRRRV